MLAFPLGCVYPRGRGGTSLHDRKGKTMDKWLINREAVEARLGAPVSEEVWARIADEVAGRVDNFIEEILDEVIEEARA